MPRFDLILRGGHVLDPANGLDGPYDVGIRLGQIESVEPELDSTDSDRVMDVTDQWVMPGVIDSHVHISTFGRNRDRALGYRQMAEVG